MILYSGAPKSSKSVMLPRINSPAAAMESAARPIWASQAVGGAGKLRNIRVNAVSSADVVLFVFREVYYILLD